MAKADTKAKAPKAKATKAKATKAKAPRAKAAAKDAPKASPRAAAAPKPAPAARAKAGIQPIGKRNPNLPFHPGVRAGDFIFVSGQVAKDEKGNMCVGNIEEETRWTIESVRRVLQAAGADLEDVVKVTVYLEDPRNFGRYNRVFAEYFPEAMLARTTVEARAAIECKIEMDAIAYKPL